MQVFYLQMVVNGFFHASIIYFLLMSLDVKRNGIEGDFSLVLARE